MRKSKMGARVGYCGHDASFVADVVQMGEVCIVSANQPKNRQDFENKLTRPAGKVDFTVLDGPKQCYWKPERGVFVVPADQLMEGDGE